MSKVFIIELNKRKSLLERRYTRKFIELYKKIINTLLREIKQSNNINLSDTTRIFNRFQDEYRILYRDIFNALYIEFGYDERKKFKFKNTSLLFVKNEPVFTTQEQDVINDIISLRVEQLIDSLVNNVVTDEFLNSESLYFYNIYNNAISMGQEFIAKQESVINTLESKIFALLSFNDLSRSESARLTRLQKELNATTRSLNKFTQNLQTNNLNTFKQIISEKIKIHSSENAQYGVSKTSDIREVEPVILSQSNKVIYNKTWWELSQFLPSAKPRKSHLNLSGQTIPRRETFFLSGFSILFPRASILPISEKAYCRCEIEYSSEVI